MKSDKKKASLSSKLMWTFNIVLLTTICAVAGYPKVSDAWNRYVANQMITTYSNAVDLSDPEELQKAREEALEYNKDLFKAGKNHIAEYTEKTLKQVENDTTKLAIETAHDETYENLMNVANNDIMGTIIIKKLNIDLPIYHYASTAVLEKGVGHLYGSSLPFGGESSHSVLTGHRGLPTMEVFTALNEMKIGDFFEVDTLGEKHQYKVVEINTVLPSELDNLSIEEGRDLITLVTCTPYGVNTHRLLVTGERVNDNEKVEVQKTTIEHIQEIVEFPTVIMGTAAGIFILALILLIYNWIFR